MNAENEFTLNGFQTAPRADTRDFESLVTLHYSGLYGFAYSLTRSEADASDLTQQTFCVWATKGNQLRDSSRVKSWLFTTLHRLFLGSHRRQVRFPHCELSTVEAELPTTGPENVDQLESAQLFQALGRLDQVYQAAVSLFYLEDCSYKEIAQMLDVPLGTVKSRIARGLTQLHKFLAGSGSKEVVETRSYS